MKARGKREARRPWLQLNIKAALKGRNPAGYFGPSGLDVVYIINQGRRASRLPLAFIFRTFGAVSAPRKRAHPATTSGVGPRTVPTFKRLRAAVRRFSNLASSAPFIFARAQVA